MRKRLVALLLGLAAVTIATAGLLLQSPVASAPGEIPELQSSLAQAAARSGDGGRIDLVSLVGNDWNRLYIFGAYVSVESIDEELGFAWDPNSGNVPLMYDGEQVLVFVRDKAVVHWALLLIANEQVRFDADQMPGSIPASEAKFRITHWDGGWTLSPIS